MSEHSANLALESPNDRSHMTADDIAQSMREHASHLRADAARWERFAALLDGHDVDVDLAREVELSDVDDAPYGRKADGTPYKRRPPTRASVKRREAKRQATLAAKREAAASAASAERIDLHVVSSLHPTESELADRELVHTTEAPAGAA
jgi:hypothetical protein